MNGSNFARAKAGRACILVHPPATRGCFVSLTSSGAIRASSIRSSNCDTSLARAASRSSLVIYRYHASLFTAPDAPSPVPGSRTPHLRCKDGSSLYDAMGPEFTLPRFDFVVDVAALEAAARHREVPLEILDIERQDAAIFHGGGLVLSCSDQHVAWHGDTLPAVDRSNPQCRELGFVRGDRFHQGHQLALHGLILDLAIRPQQPETECAVEKQQAFDLPRLAIAIVEECDGNIERSRNLLKTGGPDAVDALLVFLNLLEAHPELVAELRLRDLLLNASQPNPLSQFNVGLSCTPLLHLLCCCFHSAFTVLSVEKPLNR
jgi:hypothetical protein